MMTQEMSKYMLSFSFVESGRSDIDSPSTRTVSSQQVIGIPQSDPEHTVQRKEPFMLKLLRITN